MSAWRDRGVTLLCMRLLQWETCKKEIAANPQRPATRNSCKERNHGELGRQQGQRASPASWEQSQPVLFKYGECCWKSKRHTDVDAVVITDLKIYHTQVRQLCLFRV